MLDTLPFYTAVRARLSDNGIMAVNLLGHSRGFKDSGERIRSAFDGRSLIFPSCDSGNAIAFAVAGDPVSVSLSELKKEALLLKEETALNLMPTLTRLEQCKACISGKLEL